MENDQTFGAICNPQRTTRGDWPIDWICTPEETMKVSGENQPADLGYLGLPWLNQLKSLGSRLIWQSNNKIHGNFTRNSSCTVQAQERQGRNQISWAYLPWIRSTHIVLPKTLGKGAGQSLETQNWLGHLGTLQYLLDQYIICPAANWFPVWPWPSGS